MRGALETQRSSLRFIALTLCRFDAQKHEHEHEARRVAPGVVRSTRGQFRRLTNSCCLLPSFTPRFLCSGNVESCRITDYPSDDLHRQHHHYSVLLFDIILFVSETAGSLRTQASINPRARRDSRRLAHVRWAPPLAPPGRYAMCSGAVLPIYI